MILLLFYINLDITPARTTEAIETVTKPEIIILGNIAANMIFRSSSFLATALATSFGMINVPGNPKRAEAPIAIDISLLIPNNLPTIPEKTLKPITPRIKQPIIGQINDKSICGVALDKLLNTTVNKAIITNPCEFAIVIESFSSKPISLAIIPNIKHPK